MADSSKRLPDVPPVDVLNVKNGLLDLATKTLLPHSSSAMSVNQLPVEYDPLADCPGFDEFVRETFPEDSFEVAFEILALTAIPLPQYAKAILLLGSGANGKSTYLRAATAFLGSRNISSVSLHRLEARFSMTALVGKLANICADLPNYRLRDLETFKAITGGDDVGLEYKYGDYVSYRPWARLIFSANELPKSKDVSDGYFRRWYVVPFERQFAEDPAKGAELDRVLSSPRELGGILNRVLAVMPRVRRDGLTVTPTIRLANEAMRCQSDPTMLFILENIERDPEKSQCCKKVSASRSIAQRSADRQSG